MSKPAQPGTRHVDADGVVEVRSGRRSPVVLLSGAVVVASLAGTAWLALRSLEPAAAARAEGRRAAALGQPAAPVPARAAATRTAGGMPLAAPLGAAAPAEASPPGQETAMSHDDAGAPDAGAAPAPAPAAGGAVAAAGAGVDPGDGEGPTGIAAFPPLGTKPILRGIIVPDGVELPPGYVRHYQATDDGRMLPPILRFHPDHAPVDASGKPVAVPPDRVVPPELAPPGIPIELLDEPGAAR